MPIGNKACHARFVKAQQERHKKKLREMKASIDTKEPHTRQGGKRRNPKKEQMMEERYAQIERDNRLLLEKMSYIMRHQSMDIREDTGEYSQSLNRERRKRELQRITRENQKILARIQAAEPTYDHLEWAEHERNHEETMKRLCELPLVIHGDPAPQDEDGGHGGDIPVTTNAPRHGARSDADGLLRGRRRQRRPRVEVGRSSARRSRSAAALGL